MAGVSILTYTYVDDVLERRGPHRQAHLAHVNGWSAERGLVIGGATGNPPTGAVFVFEADRAEIEEFVAADPYHEAGLIADSSVEPWNVVVRRDFDEPVG